MTADYGTAIGMFVSENRVFINQNTHAVIVLHGTACNGVCTAQDVATFFESDPQMASTHYIVGRDGTVVQAVLEKDGAAGNCCVEQGYDPFWQPYLDQYQNLNLCTLSIEHCHWTMDNSDALTSAQQQASFELIAYLCKKYSIPASHIKTHASIAPINRARCPGNYPLAELISYVENGGNMGIPIGWSDDGTVLTAPNGKTVVAGFRLWILNNLWDSGDVPLEEQHAQSPLEAYYNQPDNEGTQQVFQYTVLNSNTERGVYREGVGNEFLGTRNALIAATATIATQSAQITQLQAEIQQLQQGGTSQVVKDDIAAVTALAQQTSTALQTLAHDAGL